MGWGLLLSNENAHHFLTKLFLLVLHLNYKLLETSNSENDNQLTAHWQSCKNISIKGVMNNSNLVSMRSFSSFVMQIAIRGFS